jgi:lipopolysaccharide export LptBFGC system permease protein LptF
MKKTLILMMLSTFLFSLNATAQKQNKKERFAWNKKYMTQLELNTDLQENILKLNADFKGKIDVVRKDEALTTEDKKVKIKKLNKQKNKKINSLLSPDEKQRSMELKKELRAKRENG